MNNYFELLTVQLIDELSLYMEITKYKTMLSNIENDIMTNPSFEDIAEIKRNSILCNLQLLFESTNRFGINPKNKQELNNWMNKCYSYINNLDIVELLKFIHISKETIELGLLGKDNYNSSILLKTEEEKVKKQKIS